MPATCNFKVVICRYLRLTRMSSAERYEPCFATVETDSRCLAMLALWDNAGDNRADSKKQCSQDTPNLQLRLLAWCCGVSGGANGLQYTCSDIWYRVYVAVYQDGATLVRQISLMHCQSLTFDVTFVVSRCPVNKLSMCFLHITTFSNAAAETCQFPSSQSFDSRRSWNVEKYDAREI